MKINRLKKAINDGRFGDGVHYTVTGHSYYVHLNNTARAVSGNHLWANTIWFKNLLSGEDVILDWVISIYCTYDQVQRFPASILKDYIANFHTELDYDDDSGQNWTAAITCRVLTKREVQTLIDQEAEIFNAVDDEDEYSVRYEGELLPFQAIVFETKLLNIRPDLEKIFKLKKKRK